MVAAKLVMALALVLVLAMGCVVDVALVTPVEEASVHLKSDTGCNHEEN